MTESVVLQTDVGPDRETEGKSALDRLASFRVLYLAILAFMVLYIFSVEVSETLLLNYFQGEVKAATRVSPTDGPIIPQIYNQVGRVIHDSPWVSLGGVRVQVTVLGADAITPLYVGSARVIPAVPPPSLDDAMFEAVRLLPAISDVFVSVPHGAVLSTGIFIAYGTVLLSGLFFYNRAIAQREAARLAAVIRARENAAGRARDIEKELSLVRSRLAEVEPTERTHSREIDALERERASLREKLASLGRQEVELQAGARQRSTELDEERQALEDLLEEALGDVNQKEGEIGELQNRLKSAVKKEPSASSKSREADRLGKRMKTLYKNLAFDDRAIADLVALRDETMKLRAEEALKRLSDDSDSASVRRKVGGLPPQLSIFELGFAGKGRIYYSRVDSNIYRVLSIGAKNSQQKDMEYLSRLSL